MIFTPATWPGSWEVSPGLTPYDEAVTRMQARAAAIHAGTAEELVWLVDREKTSLDAVERRAVILCGQQRCASGQVNLCVRIETLVGVAPQLEIFGNCPCVKDALPGARKPDVKVEAIGSPRLQGLHIEAGHSWQTYCSGSHVLAS